MAEEFLPDEPQTSIFKRRPILIVPFALLVILFTGLVIDTSRLVQLQRNAKNTTSAVVLSAAVALCNEGDPVSTGLQIAAINGYSNDVSDMITVESPPKEGPQAGNSQYVRVEIEAAYHPLLIGLLYPERPTVKASSLGRCIPGSTGIPFDGFALVGLNPSQGNTVHISGDDTLSLICGGVFSNSTHADALFIDESIQVKTESLASLCPDFMPVPEPVENPVEDPLNHLVPLDGEACTSAPSEGELAPGCYTGLFIPMDAELVLEGGIYIIDGDIDVRGTLTSEGGTGVHIVQRSGELTVTPGGVLSLHPLTDGGQWQGLTYYSPPDNPSDVTFHLGSSLSLYGTFYAPGSHLTLNANRGSTLVSQIIADTLTMNSIGQVDVIIDPDWLYHAHFPPTVQIAE